ncbi:unnamed protein product [Durusdinium trenchii]|uniref:Uncharacterized protein n=1 Tax=Durusdinium trenchii TaxID=1381693 RepID=A0ABP0JGS4_9DINO
MEGQRAAVLSAKLYRSLTTHTFSKLSAECQSLSHKSRDLQPIARHHTVSTCLTCIAQLAGLRAIIHQLTEAIAFGREVAIEMEVGTLRSSNRVVTFSFLADFFAQAGLQAPADATARPSYQPSNTFARPTKDALSLTVGSSPFHGTAKATDLGGFEDTTSSLPQTQASSGSKEQLAQREARDRHLAGIGEEAEQALQQKELWEHHMRQCLEQEQKDLDWRQAAQRDHTEMLKEQIRETKQRRAEARRLSKEQASLHDFPDFSKPSSISVRDYIMERQANLRDDLDQQVELKKRQKEQRKALDHELDRINNLACHRDLVQQQVRERERGRAALQECLESWEDTKRIKNAERAVAEFKKMPCTSRIGLVEMLSSLRSTDGSGPRESTPQYVQTVPAEPKQHTPQTARPPRVTVGDHVPSTPSESTFSAPQTARPQRVTVGDSLPSTPSESTFSMPMSSRPTTGSVRRFPISAAASLALTKQRMKERGMIQR